MNILKNIFNKNKEQEFEEIVDFCDTKIQKGDKIALYELFESTGKNPDDSYNQGKILIVNNRILNIDADGIGLKEIPKSIKNLTQLKELYIPNNYLTSLPKEIGKLPKLERLCVIKNPLTYLNKSIENSRSLRCVSWGNSPIHYLSKKIK